MSEDELDIDKSFDYGSYIPPDISEATARLCSVGMDLNTDRSQAELSQVDESTRLNNDDSMEPSRPSKFGSNTASIKWLEAKVEKRFQKSMEYAERMTSISIQKNLDMVEAKFKDREEQVAGLVGSVNRGIDSFKQEIEDLQRRMRASHEAFEKRVRSTQSHLQAKIDALDNRLRSHIDTQLGDFEKEVSNQLEAQAFTLNERATRIDNDVKAELGKMRKEAENTNIRVNDRIDKVIESNSRLNAQLAAYVSQIRSPQDPPMPPELFVLYWRPAGRPTLCTIR
jgi:uncharacterized phage infection (PIP) family protein YhgE